MQKVTSLTEQEIRSFAEVFANYEYAGGERGMLPYYPGYPDKTKLIRYLEAMIRPALEAGCAYTTSDRHEGLLILTDTTHPIAGRYVLKMMLGMVKALGIGGFVRTVKHFQAGGASLESSCRARREAFVQVELLAVQKEYQGQGHMRTLLSTAFETADREHLPVIITTDAALKKDKYVHLGMTLVNTRKVGEGSFLYDMVRQAR